MNFTKYSCEKFTEVLASKEPVPGGGGASALVGAVGVALGNMVGSLTVGKKKYAEVEEEIKELMGEAQTLRMEMLKLVEEDAEVFAPLAAAYGMPKDTEKQKLEKERVMEEVLKKACSVPFQIMECCCKAIEMQKAFAEKGSMLAVSDAGVGVIFCKSALQGASLNVFINTKAMKDRVYAEEMNQRTEAMLKKYEQRADEIFAYVRSKLGR